MTSDVPPDRVAAFRALHARTPIVVARFGGERRHAATGVEDPGVPTIETSETGVARAVLSRPWAAVVAGTIGRTALPLAYAAATARGTPFVLWTALWAQPATPAHLAAWPLMRHLYRHAGAVAAYGDHVAAYAKRHGATKIKVAPQAVDPAFWSTKTAETETPPGFLYVGRIAREKGVSVLTDAWKRTGLKPPDATLTLVGGPLDGTSPDDPGITFAGPRSPEEVRNFLGRASVLVVPSIATRAFREPWGLVVNEAMHQHVPVITSDAVGAAAGGLARHERNALVVPQRDPQALADAITRLAHDDALRTALGDNAQRDVAAFTPDAWAAGMHAAIEEATR